jgi:hypothetical protein
MTGQPTKGQVSVASIERHIFLVRGQRVMVDSDLAELYGVQTKALNQAVKRNPERFPESLMFRLTSSESKELAILRSQIVTLKTGRGRHSKYAPLVFTEHGVVMLSSVLNSSRAIEMSLFIVDVFVRLREIALKNLDFAKRLEALEREYARHDAQFKVVFASIRELIEPTRRPSKRRIGFRGNSES